MRPHAQYLMVFAETKSATRTAELLGCAPSTVYRALHRGGMSVRPYVRPYLRVVGDALAEWRVGRLREIDAEMARIRAEHARLAVRAAQLKGRAT